LFSHHHNSRFKTIRLLILTGILCLSVVASRHAVSAESVVAPEKNPAREITFENSGVTVTTNIHYTGAYCNECHEKTPVQGGDAYLKFGGDYQMLCRCHAFPQDGCVHPTDIPPSPGIKERLPSDLPLENGKVTCLTCHDIFLQCRKQLFKTDSVRGAPYPARTDFCFQCHLKGDYEQANPHHEIDQRGEIVPDTCLVCHPEKPDEKNTTIKDVKFIGDVEGICCGCHHISGNHSGDHDHIGVLPSEKGLKRIKVMEEKFNTILPLDEGGKMTCVTCHNPHDKGVIPEGKPGAVGAGSKYLHRLPGDICQECHQM
jgi:hypothetical protein